MRFRSCSGLVSCLFVLSLIIATASAVYVPPAPPSVPPSISNVAVPSQEATGTSAVVRCTVTWHYQPGSVRSVYIRVPSISSTWYSMSTSDTTNFHYLRTGLHPATQYPFTIKASEWIWYAPEGDYIKLTTYANGVIDDCYPAVTISISNVEERQAKCNLNVDWGRTTYSSTEKMMYVEYRHGTRDVWGDPDAVAFNPSMDLTGLVMSTQYDCRAKVSHKISSNIYPGTYESQWVSTSFTTSSWTPNRKYALNINLNGDIDNGEFHAHSNTITYLDGMNWASWGYIEHTVTIADGSPAETLTGTYGELRWPNWCTTPSDESSLVFIFMVGHGGLDYLEIGGGSVASEQAIADAIASINYGKLALVVEACHSGSLIDCIEETLGPERASNTLLITSSDDYRLSGILNPGTEDAVCTFSSAFLPALFQGLSFYAAFNQGGMNCFDNPVYDLNLAMLVYQDPRLSDLYDCDDVGKSERDTMFDLIIGKDGQLAYVLRLH